MHAEFWFEKVNGRDRSDDPHKYDITIKMDLRET